MAHQEKRSVHNFLNCILCSIVPSKGILNLDIFQCRTMPRYLGTLAGPNVTLSFQKRSKKNEPRYLGDPTLLSNIKKKRILKIGNPRTHLHIRKGYLFTTSYNSFNCRNK